MEKQKQKGIKDAERAVDRAFSTEKADRATITRSAQLDAAEAVAMAGIAMESDAEADEAAKLAIIASNMGNRDKAKAAREREREARNQAKIDHKAATKSAKQAYEAIKFSDPNSLGFLRVVQALFLFHIGGTLLALILTSRDTVVYSSANLGDWLMVVLESVAFYFFVNRYKLGKPMTIALAAVGIGNQVISMATSGNFKLENLLFSSVFYILLIIYCLVSSRVKATLVNDLSTDKGAFDDDDFEIDRHGWPFYRNLIIYFVIFSVLGHWMEASFCQLIRLGIVRGDYDPSNTMLWRDWFYPYPMHGTAVVLIACILYPLFLNMKKKLPKKWMAYVASFLLNMFTCTLIEFCGGLMFNANLQNWDYSDLPFNFMGQICLQNAIGFGIAASVIAWWLYPMMERLIARVRPATMNIVCIVVAVAGGILFSLYAISPPAGIDLGEGGQHHANREMGQEMLEVMTDSANLEKNAESIKEHVSNSKHLSDEEKARMKKHADEILSEVSDLDKSILDILEDAANAEEATSS